MTDRELLEKAAEVAGIEVTAVVAEGIPHRFGGGYWNPLKDDGDALRLAVKLSLWVFTPEADDDVAVIRSSDKNMCVTEENAGNANAATRRAIVRAAAAMAEKHTPEN